MIQAYKYFIMGDGAALLFETIPDTFQLEAKYDARLGALLQIGAEHTATVDDGLLNIMIETSGLYIAVSPPGEYAIKFVNFVALDRLLLGKLSAFYDVASQSGS